MRLLIEPALGHQAHGYRRGSFIEEARSKPPGHLIEPKLAQMVQAKGPLSKGPLCGNQPLRRLVTDFGRLSSHCLSRQRLIPQPDSKPAERDPSKDLTRIHRWLVNETADESPRVEHHPGAQRRPHDNADNQHRIP